jgi:hypothetical protein
VNCTHSPIGDTENCSPFAFAKEVNAAVVPVGG